MTNHDTYTPKFDGILYDGKQLPGRDPQTGRFVASTPDVHDPAWHDEPTHLNHSGYIPLEEIPSEMTIGFETVEDCERRIYGESADDPYVDEYDMYFWERECYGLANGREYHDKYAAMAERYEISEYGDDSFTTADDYVEQEEVIICTLNGEEISPEDAEEIFYGMMFDNYTISTDQSVPSFYGINRENVGTIGWWELDQKDHKAWMNRRRSTGLSRAPKWQQFAGGRKAARQSIKTLPVEETAPLDFSEVLDTHDAVMH